MCLYLNHLREQLRQALEWKWGGPSLDGGGAGHPLAVFGSYAGSLWVAHGPGFLIIFHNC